MNLKDILIIDRISLLKVASSWQSNSKIKESNGLKEGDTKKLILTAISFGFIFGEAGNLIATGLPGTNLWGANSSRHVKNKACVNAQSVAWIACANNIRQ
jgi:hypothetical protein